MPIKTLAELSKKMKDIDFCILNTKTDGGEIAGRPMSNNGEVEYNGDSYFFTYESSRTVTDVKRDPKVSMSFSGNKGLLGKPPLYITVEGQAELIQDKTAYKQHWTPDLEIWFPQGVDTPGIALLKVHASRIHFWDGEEDGEILV